MDNRTKGIIATIASALLCGCPGLFLCIFGALAATGAPITTEWQGISNTAPIPGTAAFVALGLGLIFIAIPIVVGFLTLRSKPRPTSSSEPLPPAS